MKKIALITGATSGIGRATAQKFADNGISLIVCGRREDRLNDLKTSLGNDVEVRTLNFDVRSEEAVLSAVNSLEEEWRNISILVNNAGNAHGLSTIDQGDTKDWDAMIDGNVKGLLYVSRAVIPGMVSRKSGHIVNISSIAGKETYKNGTVYCASKAAVEAISQGMRLDLTEQGIKVTNIAPGAVETEFSLVRFKGDTGRAEKVYAGFEPLKADDIADAIFYAVSAPAHVTIADMTILAAAQSQATVIHRQ
jgi:NADP-dependent 3-hydroxy acid dehydrogenase YdfG